MLRFLSASDLYAALPMPAAIEAMAAIFAAVLEGEVEAPERTVLRDRLARQRDSLMLTMPARWAGRAYGAKVSSFIGDNPAHGNPAVQGVAILLDPVTGRPRMITDAAALTNLRTAAMVGLATGHLAREDAVTLGVIGTGALAADMVAAVRHVRPIRRVLLYNRTAARARALAEVLPGEVIVAGSAAAAADADIVVLATSSTSPVLPDHAVSAGVHLNAVGNFSPSGGELQPETVARCAIWVDGYDGALAEAGDILVPAALGLIAAGRAGIAGDLAELVGGAAPARRGPEQITLFKSVGTAVADLGAMVAAAARMAEKDIGTPLA